MEGTCLAAPIEFCCMGEDLSPESLQAGPHVVNRFLGLELHLQLRKRIG